MLYSRIGMICCCLLGSIFLAQGYNCTVITSGRDTLTGKFIRADQTLTIHHTFTNRRLVFEPHQVHEFTIIHADGTQDVYQFVTDPETLELRAMRRVLDGDLKLFEDEVPFVNTVNPGLPKGTPTRPVRKVFYLASYSEDAVELNGQNWRTVLSSRLQDCPLVVENLNSRKYQFRELPAVIAAYNVCHQRELIGNSE